MNPLSVTAATGAFLVIFQVGLKAVAPEWFWTLVQNQADFWPAVQTLINIFAIKWFADYLPAEPKP